MRDRLKSSYWSNLQTKNPTQTRYRRFVKTPTGELRTPFNVAIEKWDRLKDWQKASHYSTLLEV